MHGNLYSTILFNSWLGKCYFYAYCENSIFWIVVIWGKNKKLEKWAKYEIRMLF